MCVSYLPVMQVRQECVLGYLQYQFENRPPPKKNILDNLKDTGISTYSGEVKTAAARRLQKVIDIMLQSSRVRMVCRPGGKKFPFRLGFVTLTVPGRIRKVQDVQKVFNKFTHWLRYTKTSYVWKAEFQKRGQIHYHLILNRFIPWRDITHAWNSRMKKAGFLNEWAKEHGHFMPNSCDTRSVKMSQGKSLVKYLSKYLSKEMTDGGDQIIKKWWGASRNLKAKRFVFEADYAECLKLENAKKIDGENWVIYLIDPKQVMSRGTFKKYKKWQKEIRDNI